MDAFYVLLTLNSCSSYSSSEQTELNWQTSSSWHNTPHFSSQQWLSKVGGSTRQQSLDGIPNHHPYRGSTGELKGKIDCNYCVSKKKFFSTNWFRIDLEVERDSFESYRNELVNQDFVNVSKGNFLSEEFDIH